MKISDPDYNNFWSIMKDSEHGIQSYWLKNWIEDFL